MTGTESPAGVQLMPAYNRLISFLQELRSILNAFHETFVQLEPCEFPVDIWLKMKEITLQKSLQQAVPDLAPEFIIPSDPSEFLTTMHTVLQRVLEAALSKMVAMEEV